MKVSISFYSLLCLLSTHFNVFGLYLSLFVPFNVLSMEQLVEENMPCPNIECTFSTQKFPYLSKYVADCRKGRENADSSFIAERICVRAQKARLHRYSISTTRRRGVWSGSSLPLNFCSSWWTRPWNLSYSRIVYQAAEILTDLCGSDRRGLVGELLSIFQSAYFDSKIFWWHLTTTKPSVCLGYDQKNCELKSVGSVGGCCNLELWGFDAASSL